MVVGQLNTHMQSVNLDTDLTTFTRINSVWIIDLNVKHEAIKAPRK